MVDRAIFKALKEPVLGTLVSNVLFLISVSSSILTLSFNCSTSRLSLASKFQFWDSYYA